MKYFLKTLHQLPLFNGKHGVSSMARYTRIKTYLTDPKVSILMHFVAVVAQDSEILETVAEVRDDDTSASFQLHEADIRSSS